MEGSPSQAANLKSFLEDESHNQMKELRVRIHKASSKTLTGLDLEVSSTRRTGARPGSQGLQKCLAKSSLVRIPSVFISVTDSNCRGKKKRRGR